MQVRKSSDRTGVLITLDIFTVFRTGSVPEIVAQIIGFLALAASVASFQMKTYRKIMLMQMICAALFVIHMGMLFLLGHSDAISGCAGNAVCLVRDAVYLATSDRQQKRPWLRTAVFSAMMIVVGVLTWRSPISLICIVGLVLNTVSFSVKEPQNVRKLILFSSPFFMVYNFLSASIGGVCNEIISFLSAVVGLIRYRKAKHADPKHA